MAIFHQLLSDDSCENCRFATHEKLSFCFVPSRCDEVRRLWKFSKEIIISFISASGFGNFASNATNFHQLFPKIRSKFATLKFHFFVPFYRELFLSWGMMSVTPSSIKTALSQSNDENDQSNFDGFTSTAVSIYSRTSLSF